MDMIYISLILGLLGLVFGSFAGAQVWRLRARQLAEDKRASEPYSKQEYNQLAPLMKHKGTADRSQCLYCHHQLHWYDLLPLVSWARTKGKCHYCQHPIGFLEPLIEIGVAVFFAASFLYWPFPLESTLAIVQLGLWLLTGVMLAILFAYDTKWFLLPDRVVVPLIAVAVGFSVISIMRQPDVAGALVSTGEAIVILAGLYLALWLISHGRWIGFGDVKLGLILALLVGTWQLAFLTLFLANLIGCLIVLPGLITKKLSRTTQVPFGPMLIVAGIITVLWGDSIIGWYLTAFI
jgi:prepilin signal peptidase PulO-like enzyme (type II secretory pathway)